MAKEIGIINEIGDKPVTMNSKRFNGRNIEKYPVTFIPPNNIIQLSDGSIFIEQWKSIHDYYPEIKDYYCISNTGKIFHKYFYYIMPLHINMNGYYQKHFTTVDGSITKTIHRILMNCFCPINNSDQFDINHIDGNKLNNCILNLEWCTRTENIVHAMRTGLNTSPTLNESQVHNICKLLENHLITIPEISNITEVPISTIATISEGHSYKYISCQYNITPRKISAVFSTDEINKLCNYFEINKKNDDESLKEYISRALINLFGYFPHNEYKSDSKFKSAKDIYQRKHFTNISNNYKF